MKFSFLKKKTMAFAISGTMIASLFAGAALTSAAPATPLYTQDFENGMTNISWNQWSAPGSIVAEGHNSAHSFQIDTAAEGYKNGSLKDIAVDLVSGKEYQISFYAKGGLYRVSARYDLVDEETQEVTKSDEIITEREYHGAYVLPVWTKLIIKFTAPKNLNKMGLAFQTGAQASGNILVDDIVVSEADDSQENLVINGSFDGSAVGWGSDNTLHPLASVYQATGGTADSGCIKIDAKDENHSYFDRVDQSVNGLVKGNKYTLEFMSKGKASVFLRTLAVDSVVIDGTPATNGAELFKEFENSDVWQKHTIDFVYNGDTSNLDIRLYPNGVKDVDTAWFDDVSITNWVAPAVVETPTADSSATPDSSVTPTESATEGIVTPTADPVVYSEGFEDLTNIRDFAGYGAFEVNENLVKFTDEDAYTGSKSVKFAGGWNVLGTQAKGKIPNTVFKPNTDYVFSAWVKGNIYYIEVYTPSDTENHTLQKFEVNGGGLFDQWTEVKIPFRVGEKTVMTQGSSGDVANQPFEMKFQNANTEMYLDDITIREGTIPVTETPTATATPTSTPTATATTTTTTVNKAAYVPVSKVSIAKVAGTTKTTAKSYVYKKAATNKGKWTTISKNKTVSVKSVSGNYAKVTVKVKGKTRTGYVKVANLKFGKTQRGKVLSTTKAYKKASTRDGYYQSFAKNKTFTIQSRYKTYYKTTVSVKVTVTK